MRGILEFCEHLPQRSLAPGEVLIEEGGAAGAVYLLAAGELEVIKGELQIRTVSQPGAVFGEVAVLLDCPPTATVRALSECRVYVVDDARAFLQSQQEVAYHVAVLLAQRLHSITTYLVDLKRQYEDQEDHLGMVDEVLETLTHQQPESIDVGSDRDPDRSL